MTPVGYHLRMFQSTPRGHVQQKRPCSERFLCSPTTAVQVSNAVKFTESGSIFVCVQVASAGLATLTQTTPLASATPQPSPVTPSPKSPFLSTLRRRFRSSSSPRDPFEGSQTFEEGPITPSTPLSKSVSSQSLVHWSSGKKPPAIQIVGDLSIPSLRAEDSGEAEPGVLERFKEAHCGAQPGEKIRLLISVEDTGIG